MLSVKLLMPRQKSLCLANDLHGSLHDTYTEYESFGKICLLVKRLMVAAELCTSQTRHMATHVSTANILL